MKSRFTKLLSFTKALKTIQCKGASKLFTSLENDDLLTKFCQSIASVNPLLWYVCQAVCKPNV